jgi:beta-phosphoglucomutase
MKIPMYDLENVLEPGIQLDAQDLARSTHEFDIRLTQPGHFLINSKLPDFEVEIDLRDDGLAIAKCQCTTFRKTKKCAHAVASVLLLRDHLRISRKSKKKENLAILESVLKKVQINELKSFLANYANSHVSLRAELLARYLYLTRNPDYHHLYQDLIPVNKFGQIQLNRNNIKTLRSVNTNLLKRAQQLLQEKSIHEALSILETVLVQLHKLWSKATNFQDSLSTDLKTAYKLFEWLCTMTMAPRLQKRVTELSLNICGRDNYIFPAGFKPLLQLAECFFLEDKMRKEAIRIGEEKILNHHPQSAIWAGLLFHWTRIWSLEKSGAKLLDLMKKHIPEIIREFTQHGMHEDVLSTLERIDIDHFTETESKQLLRSGLLAADRTSHQQLLEKYAIALSTQFLDQNAWEILLEADKGAAIRWLKVIDELHRPGDQPEADEFVMEGWRKAGDLTSLLTRIKGIDDLSVLMNYDTLFRDELQAEVIRLYASHVQQIRDTYGGVIARQKLSNIFGHLKANQLFSAVQAELAKANKLVDVKDPNEIKGFVFDLDGVIVDTAVHHFQSWKKIMKELGVDIVDEDDDHTRGASRMESLEYLLRKYQVSLTEEEKQYRAARKNDIYVQAIENITPADLLPGVISFLEESRKEGLLLALGSASKNARPVLEKLSVAGRFDAILDGNDAKASKPDPEIFTKACAALGLSPHQVVVFEDAAKGVQAALSAGCYVVGIGDKETLSAAHIIIKGLAEANPKQIIDQLT